ncbi:MAG: hypothetical protein QXR45_09890 [Candidatus Bathyarchaeia archaeon]
MPEKNNRVEIWLKKKRKIIHNQKLILTLLSAILPISMISVTLILWTAAIFPETILITIILWVIVTAIYTIILILRKIVKKEKEKES